jgi:hypothetical protein
MVRRHAPILRSALSTNSPGRELGVTEEATDGG